MNMSFTGSLPDYKSRKHSNGVPSHYLSDRLYSDLHRPSRQYDSITGGVYGSHPRYLDEHRPSPSHSDTTSGSTRRLKDPKTHRDVLRRFTDTTSLQGIPFIISAHRWYAKVLWSLVFLGAVAMWLLHSVTLLQSYIAFETASQVKITFKTLEFPTVTLCNINPIRENTINRFGNQDLERLISLLRPKDRFDDSEENNSGNGMPGNPVTRSSAPENIGDTVTTGAIPGDIVIPVTSMPDPINDNTRDRSGGAGGNTSDNVGDSVDSGAEANIGTNTTGDRPRPPGNERPGGNEQSTDGGSPPDRNGDMDSGLEPPRRPPRGKRQTNGIQEEPRDSNFRPNNIDFTEFAHLGNFEEFLNQGYSESYLAKILLEIMLSYVPDYNRTYMGHRLGDMLLGCSYDGKPCINQDFNHFLDKTYGNCFSFNSAFVQDEALTSVDSGSSNGLDMIMYIQNRDYIKGIQQGRGLRVYVHPYGTQPFVEDSGMSIPAGFQTYMGIRQIQQTRLGGRYGECGDEGQYEQYYTYENYTYTLDACLRTCVDRLISRECGCYRKTERQFYNEEDVLQNRSCSATEFACVEDIERRARAMEANCNCHQSCESTDYDFALSFDQWPDDTLWHSLIQAVCETVPRHECETLKLNEGSDRRVILEDNFLHLKIYYRDLNLETIVEVPAYEDIQFYSDIGGAVGLWLGASILTIFELGDLVVRLIQFCVRKDVYKKRRKRLNQYSETTSFSVSAPVSSQNSPALSRKGPSHGSPVPSTRKVSAIGHFRDQSPLATPDMNRLRRS